MFNLEKIKNLSMRCMCALLSLMIAPIFNIANLTERAVAEVRKRPNIIFIFADDVGWGDLGVHGHPRIKTPNLDRMVAEGTDFHEGLVVSPVCSPSRTGVLTGQFPVRHGVHEHFASSEENAKRGMPDYLDPNVTLLPKLLQNAGYKTAHFGKWHLTSNQVEKAPLPSEYGYNEYGVFNGGPGATGVWDGISNLQPQDANKYPYAYLTRGSVEKTLRFMEQNKDAPFFVNLWIKEAHTPIQATPEDRKEYPDVSEPEQTYYSAITSADKQIGRVLDKLKELGLDEDTLIVFSSDNGPETPLNIPNASRYYSRGSAGDFKGQKRSLYDGGVRVPYIVRWPGKVPAGVVNKTTTASTVDLLPTFCEVAGVTLPVDYKPDGESVLSAFLGNTFQRTKPIFWEWTGTEAENPELGDYWWPRLAVHDGKWKIYTNFEGNRTALFDMISDPTQNNDVSSKNPEITKALVEKALKWREDTYANMIWKGQSTSSTDAPKTDNSNQERLGKAIALFVNNPTAFVNNKKTSIDLQNSKVVPIIKDGRTLVPVRFISESLGAKVEWDDTTSTITVTMSNRIVKMVLGSTSMSINNEKVTIDVPAQTENGRTLIPLRALVEALGKKVFWDDRGLIIISDNENIFDKNLEKVLIDSIVNLFVGKQVENITNNTTATHSSLSLKQDFEEFEQAKSITPTGWNKQANLTLNTVVDDSGISKNALQIVHNGSGSPWASAKYDFIKPSEMFEVTLRMKITDIETLKVMTFMKEHSFNSSDELFRVTFFNENKKFIRGINKNNSIIPKDGAMNYTIDKGDWVNITVRFDYNNSKFACWIGNPPKNIEYVQYSSDPVKPDVKSIRFITGNKDASGIIVDDIAFSKLNEQ